MQRILALIVMTLLFACSKPADPNPDPDPGGGGQGAALAITSVSPETGNPNTIMVIISGKGFNATPADNEVLLNTLAATVRTASVTQLVIELPIAITEGTYDVTVKTNGRSVTKKNGFRYESGNLEIVTVTPENVFPNTQSITINGRGFSAFPTNNEVHIGNFTATVTTARVNQLIVNVPANMTTGTYDVKVMANGKTATKINALKYDNTVVTTFVGSGTSGTADGIGTQAQFILPIGLTKDAANNLYVADMHRIRKITPNGQVSTYAGSGQKGADDGASNLASFNSPTAIAADLAGNLYIADEFNHSIRMVSTNGTVSTIAGSTTAGSSNGIGTAASFNLPYGIAVNPQGTVLYVADYANHRIRKIDLQTREVTNYAGDGSNTSKDGTALQAGIPWPGGLHLSEDGSLYITEKGAGKIRKISPAGNVTTIGGSLSVNKLPVQLTVDHEENTYVVYKGNNHVKKYTKNGIESVIFGNGNSGDTEGPAAQASFFVPEGIVLIESADGKKTFYIADSGNKKIKKIVM